MKKPYKVNLEVLEDRTAPSFILGANAPVILGPVSPPPVNTWYQDRFRPADFAYHQTGGGRTDIVLQSISASDANGLRPTLSPTAYNIPFCDIQGQKRTWATGWRSTSPTCLAPAAAAATTWPATTITR
jgi:hypothetical protein